jgi:hypothetical protein
MRLQSESRATLILTKDPSIWIFVSAMTMRVCVEFCKNTRENRVSSFIKVERIVHSYKGPSITSDRLPNPRTTVRTSLFL